MSNILERVLDGTIKTNASWLEKTGYHPVVLAELIKEHWICSLMGSIVAIFGFVASL